MYRFRKGYYADVRIEDRFTTEITVKNGQLEQRQVVSVKKAFLRVFDGNRWYYASTSDPDGIADTLDELYGYAAENPDIEAHPIVRLYQVNRDEKLLFSERCVKDIPLEAKQKKLFSACEKLVSPHLQLAQGTYLDRYSRFEFFSSKGSALQWDYQTAGLSLVAGLSNGGEPFVEALQRAGTEYGDAAATEEEIKAFLAECETFLAEAKPVQPGAYPVVLSPIATGIFAHESFGHKSEADFMIGDEAMAKEWEIGKQVASPLLNIYETGTLLGSGYTPYDDEGTKAGRTDLIRNGVLSGRLHSAATAAYLGEALTGNARAIGADYEPIVRMTNTVIAGGTDSFEALIGGISHGFYIKTVKHGSGMSTFTIAPNIAYEIVDGKIGSPVKIAALTGSVFETLGLIDGVGNDETVLSFVTGGCGKMEQYPLPVGLGGPHIRVAKMNVQ